MLQRIRRCVQAGSLLVFLVLLVLTRYGGTDELAWPVRLYLDLDPLILLGTLLAAHTVPAAFLASTAMLLLTLLLGRAFCGWLCPFGALNQLAGRWRGQSTAKGRNHSHGGRLQGTRYGILLMVLAAASLGFNALGIMDPISLTIRSLGLAIGPVLEWLVRSCFTALYNTAFEPLLAVSEPGYNLLKRTLLSFQQPAFRGAEIIGLIFLAILALNLWLPRFWCRHLCPLGALLSLGARMGSLRLGARVTCNNCGRCSTSCPAGANPHLAGAGGWRPADCFVCGNCTASCKQSLGFDWTWPRLLGGKVQGFDTGRRTILAGTGAGFMLAPLVRVTNLVQPAPPERIRPPGSRPEKDFLARCLRCGECMKVCLTNGLHPMGLQQGLEGLWTPVLVPVRGYCEFNCTLCGQICPTGAIRRLSLGQKQRTSIGTAHVDPMRCLPLALGRDCIVCEEHCPTSPKAIRTVQVRSFLPDGSSVTVHRPLVDPDLCIGCGICEAVCPVLDRPGIRVSSMGETRDPDNQCLLSGGGY